MEISNSNTLQTNAPSQITQNVSPRRAADERREVEAVERDQRNLAQQSERFDADQEAIAFVEQELASTQLLTQDRSSGNPQNSGQPNQNSASNYDQPSEQNLSAVNAYQTIDNLSQRENIQQVFGVDLLA